MNNSGIINPNIPEKPEALSPAVPPYSNNWLKVGLLGLAVLVAGVLVYTGYWYGKESEKLKSQSEKQQLKTENLIPTVPLMVTSQLTLPSESTLPPNETANRKSYTNTKYNFSFEFPTAWTLDDSRLSGPLFKDQSGQSILTVNIFPNIRYGLEGEYLSEEEVMKKLASTIVSQEAINIGGENGLISNNEQQLIQSAVFVHNGEGYLFSFQTSKKIPRSLFIQILSTFRFLE